MSDPATEKEPFTDAFWEGLDGVCNALDNMEARFYVDRTCVMFERARVRSRRFELRPSRWAHESGFSGNVDPIVPHKTKTYREGGNAAEGPGRPDVHVEELPASHRPLHRVG